MEMSEISLTKVWLMAIRPKTLTAAVIPVVLGTTLAHIETAAIEWPLAICALFCAVCLQIGTNLINDALDFQKGVDTIQRIGPVRVTQAGLLSSTQVLGAAVACLLLGAFFGLAVVIHVGAVSALLLLLSLLLTYFYTGGPFPISHLGLGEVFVFVFFGLVATAGACYIHTHAVTGSSLVLGSQIGLLAVLLMVVNNVRDYTNDLITHKRTLVVRCGVLFGKGMITWCALAPFALNLYWMRVGAAGGALMAATLPWLALPLAIAVVKKVWQHPPSSLYNRILFLSALLHVCFGMLLALGLLVS